MPCLISFSVIRQVCFVFGFFTWVRPEQNVWPRNPMKRENVTRFFFFKTLSVPPFLYYRRPAIIKTTNKGKRDQRDVENSNISSMIFVLFLFFFLLRRTFYRLCASRSGIRNPHPEVRRHGKSQRRVQQKPRRP